MEKPLRGLLVTATVVLAGGVLPSTGCVTTFPSGGSEAHHRIVSRDHVRADAGPVCARFDVGESGSLIAAASVQGLQDVPAGVTPSGSSVLVQRGMCSRGLSLLIVDETDPGSGIYRARAVPPLANVETSIEESVTLEADGLGIVGLTPDLRGFVELARSAIGEVDFRFATVQDYAQITAFGSRRFWAPALSPDGLAFYYVVQGDPNPALNGIYESVRASLAAPFPPGTRMPDLVQSLAQYVNGLSSDRLAIFLEERTVFRTSVLTRASVSDPFTNPRAPDPPPSVPGLRTRPLADCTRLVGSCGPQGGGCSNESICTWGWRDASDAGLPRAVEPSQGELL